MKLQIRADIILLPFRIKWEFIHIEGETMSRKQRKPFPSKVIFFIAIVTMVVLAACTSKPTTELKPTETEPKIIPSAEAGPTEPTVAPPTEIHKPTEEPGLPSLPAEPQRVEFQAEDGKNLVGYYYPAAVNPSPAVILMHWARGDQRDWFAIAPWMQNRPNELANVPNWNDAIGADCGEQMIGPWLDASWFPSMPEAVSLAVFTFDFRDFCESESGTTSRSEWALDAKAALTIAGKLPGIDPSKIVAIGASIGADGAVDGCLLHNKESSTCLGGMSFSPGSYLNMLYTDVVAELEGAEPPVPVWCLAAEGDTASSNACHSASGNQYKMFMYEGDAHGMMLIAPGHDQDPMVLIQEFLEETLGVEIK